MSSVRQNDQRSARFHRWRLHKDRLARRVIGLGGVAVIAAVLLIMFYLFYVVLPLFLPASVTAVRHIEPQEKLAGATTYLSMEEQQQVAFRINHQGSAQFLSLTDLKAIGSRQLFPTAVEVAAVAVDQENTNLVAVAYTDGRAGFVRQRYRTDFSAGIAQRRIVPALEYPYGGELRELMPGGGVSGLALSDSESELVLAAAGSGGRVRLLRSAKQENFLSGEVSLESTIRSLDLDYEINAIALSNDHRWLYLGDSGGAIHFIETASMRELQAVQTGAAGITSLRMLLGGISVLVGTANGRLLQLFPVRDADNHYALRIIRQFEPVGSQAVRGIYPEQRRKGFVSIDAGGQLAVYHSTANRLVLRQALAGGAPAALALAPRAAGLLLLNTDGSADFMALDNPHPEVSFSSLWSKVWFENYQQPEYIWQSSASNDDFEPKFSLTPLAFGTLKAALYAMLFALPLALLGAAYTAYFMSPALRGLVKPGIEIMAALPTVILGFLAGLWFAPFLEENLAGVLTLMLVSPVGALLFAWLWARAPGRLRALVPDGWEPLLLLPVLVLVGVFSIEVAGPLQQWFFEGDLRVWMNQELGIGYDQRNAMVVGWAMGFAVIPTIFSIAEDAVYGVPGSLSDGSLALGATRWQTLVRVVLPTASPGIFSGVMIGLGRAVGETMIVLMATGNTPVTDWNLFSGMRTLAANIAVEMPESAVHSTHYRILFLAALVLFLFTFVVNTGAELIRQHLREKYSSL